jgi:CBS-domain-containing membrane protein
MQIKDLMTTKVISVQPTASVSEVAEVLRIHKFSGVPVVGEDNKVLGLISQNEMFAVDSKVHIPTYVHLLKETKFVIKSGNELPYVEQQIVNLKAQDIMNQDIFLAEPEMELGKLVEIFVYREQNPILVADTDKHILGIVSRSDLIKTMLPKLSVDSTPLNVRPRIVDKQLEYVRKDLSSHFSYVSKIRANIWVTAMITLMIVGFIGGIIFTADPKIFTN